MDNRNYIITYDENGQPYIAHVSWGGVKSAAQAEYKRIMAADPNAYRKK